MEDQDYARALELFEALPEGTPEGTLRSQYEETVHPRARDRIRRSSAAPVDQLILTAGSQPYSISLSLEASPATSVVFLCTEESQESAERAANSVLGSEVRRRYERVEKADAISVYRAVLLVHEALLKTRAPEAGAPKVIVDITSGTKAMTAAASSAAVVIGAEQRYVESSPTRHRGYFARERIHAIEHPLIAMGDLERREAERLFDRLALDHAAALFTELHECGAPDYRFHERSLLAQAYLEVDRLHFAAAVDLLGQALPRLQSRLGTRDPLCDEAARIEEQRLVLSRLSVPKPDTEILLRFFVAYAKRRAAQGLLDAAALVQYRTIELAIQHRLEQHGIDAHAATADAYGVIADRRGRSAEQLLKDFNRLAGSHHEVAVLPDKLSLAQGWTMLRVLSDPLVDGISTDRLLGQAKARNESIFAHGRKPLAQKAFDDFAAVAAQVRAKLAEVERWTIPDPDPAMEFVQFNPR